MNEKPRPLTPGMKFGLLLMAASALSTLYLGIVVGTDPWLPMLLAPIGLLITLASVPRHRGGAE